MANLKKRNKQLTFDVSSAFTNSMKNIAGTSIMASQENFDFYSMKNTVPDATLGKVCSRVAYEIATAIKEATKRPEMVMVGKVKSTGEKYYFGSFSDGNDSNDFVILPESNEILATNAKSNDIYTLIAYMNVAEFIMKGANATPEDAEIFELAKQMNFNTKIIDSDQNSIFIPLCDSLYFEAKKLNGASIVEKSNEEIIDFVLADGEPKFNLIELMGLRISDDRDKYEINYEDASGNDVTIPPMKCPTLKGKGKKLKRSSKAAGDEEETVNPAELDYALMTDEDANALPEHLQLMRQKAIAFYEENKDFLTEEQWSLIKSFKRGRLWKLGAYGPSATGKTSFIKCLAGALRVPFAIVVGSKGMDETRLFGKYVIKDNDMVFEDGPLTEMMKYGGLFLLDEENMVAPEVISSMNSILDDTRIATLESGEIVHVHDNFRYCEAMNMAYAGTLEQNLSHESRVQLWVKFAGYDENTEAKIISKETGIEEAIALKMVQVKNRAMEAIKGDLGDDTTQNVDLRSCIAWADRTIDCDGDAVKASLTTVLSQLVKEDDAVVSSASVENYEKSQEVAVQIVSDIVDTFKNISQPKKEYVFDTYEI